MAKSNVDSMSDEYYSLTSRSNTTFFTQRKKTAPTFPSVDNNASFKYIKASLANKHQQAANRPDFKIAGIARVPQPKMIARDFDEKFTKR